MKYLVLSILIPIIGIITGFVVDVTLIKKYKKDSMRGYMILFFVFSLVVAYPFYHKWETSDERIEMCAKQELEQEMRRAYPSSKEKLFRHKVDSVKNILRDNGYGLD